MAKATSYQKKKKKINQQCKNKLKLIPLLIDKYLFIQFHHSLSSTLSDKKNIFCLVPYCIKGCKEGLSYLLPPFF